MLKKILVVLAALILIAAGVFFVVFRLHFSDPSRTPYCRVLDCKQIDGFDALCGLLAQAEFQAFATPGEQLAWLESELQSSPDSGTARTILDRVRRTPPGERYDALLTAVRAEGAPRWTCPAAERTLAALP